MEKILSVELLRSCVRVPTYDIIFFLCELRLFIYIYKCDYPHFGIAAKNVDSETYAYILLIKLCFTIC